MSRTARLTSIAGIVVLIAGLSCKGEGVTAIDDSPIADTTLALPAVVSGMRVLTYDGSGQAVHPDYLTPLKPWSHRPRFLALTPYPFSDRSRENPALYSGSNGFQWSVATGTPNPLAYPKSGFLSDPDIVYANARNELFLYYRQATDSDYIQLIRSTNGVQWGGSTLVTKGRLNGVLSPAIVRLSSGDWRMWSVNAEGGCDGPSTSVEIRYSSDGLYWGPPMPVNMEFGGRYAWHLDVQYVPKLHEFWAVAPVKTPGTCTTKALAFARSEDGLTWEAVANDVAIAGVIPEFGDIVYRSTFAYDPSQDALMFWMSGARFTDGLFVWRTAAVRKARAEVFDPIRHTQQQLRSADADQQRQRVIDSLFVPPA